MITMSFLGDFMDSRRGKILMGIILAIFSFFIVVFGIFKIYWLVGTIIGFSIIMLVLTEPGWEVRDWYTFVISGATISLIFLIPWWMQESKTASDVIQGFSAMTTVLMVFYVAIQTHSTKQSLEEMKKQRLTPIIVEALEVLRSLKSKLEKNFEVIHYGAADPRYPDNLLELTEELERPEFLVVDSLFEELGLYNDIKDYQENIGRFKKHSEDIKLLIKEIGEEKLMNILENVKKEMGIEFTTSIFGDGYINFPESSTGKMYQLILGLARETAMGDPNIEKLYWKFKGLMFDSGNEKMKKLSILLQELWSAMLVLVPTPDEEDAKQGIQRDNRIKKIEIAIKRLEDEYIK